MSLGKSKLQRNPEQFVADAAEAIELKFVEDSDSIDDEPSFHPEYTHQFFGDGERIFGYRDLAVKLYFAASSMHPYFHVSYSDKVDPLRDGCPDPDPVAKLIGEKLPTVHSSSLEDFKQRVDESLGFQPPGDLVHSYIPPDCDCDDVEFAVYKGNSDTPGLVEFHDRIQILVLLYIDGASYIDTSDRSWSFYFLFEKVKSDTAAVAAGAPLVRYLFAGYLTAYDFYAYPESVRPRISQVLILPPYQKQGNGAQLLQAFYNDTRLRRDVIDISVEDPAISFARLRDTVDAKNCLLELPELYTNLPDEITPEIVEATKAKLKLNKKQIKHIFELLKLRNVDRSNEEEYRKYRLLIKKRLHRQYNDELVALDMKSEKLQVLGRLYKEVEEYYLSILSRL